MGQPVSHEMMLIQNLVNASKWHGENCRESCGVSLHQMKQAAQFIARFLRVSGRSDAEEAEKLANGMTSI